MEKIRVLVADDSIVIRRVVTEELSSQPDIEVIGSAATGRAVVEKLPVLNPDIVILDVEMPEMDGLTALPLIRRSHPRTPVIMFSSLTMQGAAATLEALARGASDFLAKPAGSGGLEASRNTIRAELIPMIRELCPRKVPRPAATPVAVASTVSPLAPATPSASALATAFDRSSSPAKTATAFGSARVDVVVIGASTGGPNALSDLFGALPAKLPVPILVVQHMPPLFTKLLAERLSRNSKIATEEAVDGAVIEPGRAWIAPGNFHMVLERERTNIRTRLHQEPPENGCRPAVDPLLRSIASLYGRHCLAVVLTGMGQDGLRGAESIRAVGGQILAQDEATSVVWGMPGVVARAGLADRVLPLPLMAGEIVRRVTLYRG